MVSSEVSMSSKRYTGEFKIEVVGQVADLGFEAAKVAERLGVTTPPNCAIQSPSATPPVLLSRAC